MSLKEANNKKETNILMVAFAALGHINPMLTLGNKLLQLSKGLHVTLATTETARPFFPPSSTASGIHLHFFSDGVSPDFDRTSDIDLYMQTLAQFGPVNLSTFVQSRPSKFSCIISNPFVPWAADVATEHGIPCAMLWIQPCSLYAIYYRFYKNLNEFPTSKNPHMSVELPGLPLLHTRDLPSFVLPSNSFTSFPKILAQVFGNVDKLKWVLGNSYYKLEEDVIRSMDDIHPIIPVGPLVGQDKSLDISVDNFKSGNNCIEWLNEQEPSSVIYISFGSIIEFSKSDIESISSGLKNSKFRFLWVVKGEKMLPLGFLEETKAQGIIVKWCSQIEVLSHPSIGCFLSHCGWNSSLESITAGVPIIAYPQWTDQPTNAKLVTDVLRVGVRLGRDEGCGLISSDEVEKCIEEVMSGPRSEEFRKNAAELKRAAGEAVAEGGSSYRNIQVFVDEIVGSTSCS